MNKMINFFKKQFIISIFILLVFFGISSSIFNVNAASTCNADYQQSSVINSVNLDYGVKYRSVNGNSRYTLNGDYVPQVCNYLEIPSNQGLLVTSWSNFKSDGWKLSHVDDVAKNFEATHPGYRVIAITNGDFYDINGADHFPYSPTGALVSDGNFYKATPTRATGYKVLSFTNDGTANSLVTFDQSQVSVKSLPTLSVYDENGNVIKELEINKVNEAPSSNEIAVYYGIFSNKHYNMIETDKNAKKTFVVQSPVNYLPNGAKDFYGLGTISSLGSRSLVDGEFAISSNNDEVNAILGEGVMIRVQYQWNGKAGNVKNALNAGTQILVNGEAPSNVNTADGSRMNARHPRTAIGVKNDGTVILMVNDGRQADIGRNGSYGNELAAMMKHYGCVNAFNLDGGGSSIMYYNDGDELVLGNSFSDPPERTVSNAVIVAVKDPELKVEFDRIGSRDVEISVDLINNNKHKIDSLYAHIGSKTEKIENGKATISGLSPLTGYDVRFSFKTKEGVEFKLPFNISFGTKAREYKIKDLEITDNGDTLLLNLDYSDQANATTLATAKIYINGKEYQLVDGKVTVNKSDVAVIEEIKLEFQNQIYQGYETVILINPHAPYLNVLKDVLSVNNQMIEDILK